VTFRDFPGCVGTLGCAMWSFCCCRCCRHTVTISSHSTWRLVCAVLHCVRCCCGLHHIYKQTTSRCVRLFVDLEPFTKNDGETNEVGQVKCVA